MSDNGSVVHVFTCPICHHKKTPVQRDLICGKCVHQNTEIIRNSVVENEALNKQMRIQIDQIFQTCIDINVLHTDDTCQNTTLPIPASGIPKDKDIPQPEKSSLFQLAHHLQKLDVMNRQIKINGLQKSQEYLGKKNQALEDKICNLTQKIEKNQKSISIAQTKMLEDYSRKLEHLDIEIISLKYEGMKRISRQAALKQYSSYRIIRDSFFTVTMKTDFNFCNKPILNISKFPETQISTVNTYLEDLIRLLLILFELFSIDDETLQLPYLEQLRKLLPDQAFYNSVQKKIDIILQKDDKQSSESVEHRKKEHEEVEERVNEQERSGITQRDFGKVTIKDNTIQVPKSFRTMNLQRRSSIKESDNLEGSASPGAENQIPSIKKNKFVMVPQENSKYNEDLSQKSSARLPMKEGKNVGQSELKDSKNTESRNGTKVDWQGKKIVIVPHRILPKPFTKLRPNEYLKFVSIVVKILVTFNELLRKLLGTHLFQSDHEMHTKKLQREGDSQIKRGGFIYDLRKILTKVSTLDHYFQQKAQLKSQSQNQNQMQESEVNDVVGIANTIDASLLTTSLEDSKSMRESLAADPGLSEPSSPQSNFQMLRSFYTKLVSKKSKSDHTIDLNSPTDNAIYGMVSETRPQDYQRIKDVSGPVEEKGSKESKLSLANNGQVSTGYELQEISRKVHDIISGHTSSNTSKLRGGNSSSNIDRLGANSVMQQSRAHLEDWDVVSKMF